MNNIISVFLALCMVIMGKAHAEPWYDEDDFEWQLSLGAFYVNTKLPKLIGSKHEFSSLAPLIDAKLQYKKFYLNTHSGDFFGGSDLGYQLIQEEEWGLDAIFGNYQIPFSETGYYSNEDDVVEELRGVKPRKVDQSIGLAYYRNIGDFLAVAELVYDVLGESNGWVFHVEATRNFELRNWDLWLNFGANYYSQNFNNYFYGVSPSEVNDYLHGFTAGDGATVFVQTQINYPIAQDWVYSAGASVLVGSGGVKSSPLVDSNYARVFFTGVKYVF
ncbi:MULTISPECIES: MipA/OmpV family protein [Pseudoalteromonas]|uniref:MipA/OmpV family protein n=1 Tax=Pseudoalteromonas obscura TaxID=3048491 RepID=A0ABT7EMP6_9GAMM|nr:MULTISPECIES: MipA/OmpV family protein [Pseudoalteromonas]MDK2596298.1 MipA/OmpV family protein [Pseudoalteromonas sp. P94(2023)]